VAQVAVGITDQPLVVRGILHQQVHRKVAMVEPEFLSHTTVVAVVAVLPL
jgi:hypothetical protein